MKIGEKLYHWINGLWSGIPYCCINAFVIKDGVDKKYYTQCHRCSNLCNYGIETPAKIKWNGILFSFLCGKETTYKFTWYDYIYYKTDKEFSIAG